MLIGLFNPGFMSKTKIRFPEKVEYFIGYSQGKVAKLQGNHICVYLPNKMSNKQFEGFVEGNIK